MARHGAVKSSGGVQKAASVAQRLREFNRMLVFVMVYLSFCAFNFGYDVGTFGGVQAMRSFAEEFGEYDEEKKMYALPGWLSSVMTATPFLGKAVGCAVSGWMAEKWGRRRAILLMCTLSFVGAVLQTSAKTAAQFTVGRVLIFAMTGFVIVVLPLFQAEVSPKAIRGMFGSMLQLMIVLGQVTATLVSYGTHDLPDSRAWKIPVGLQLVLPFVTVLLLPLLPESPRWLLSQGRAEDAAGSLARLRPRASAEDIQVEIKAILHAHADQAKGTWAEVFDRKNRIRTGVAVLAMFGQQITGQTFPSQYGVIFYQTQGFASRAFLFNVAASIVSLGAVIMTWLYVDEVGRRPVLLTGGLCMGLSLFMLGGVASASQEQLDRGLRHLIVASILLFCFFFNLSWAPISYIVVSETAALRVKEKTNLLACVVSVLTAFATSFSTPYLINPHYANLGGKVGYIFGSFNLVMVVATFFCIPELKGRTLEEVDQLFESGVPLRRFGSVRTKTAQEMYDEDFGHDTR
ncbi:general substrate transporter [Stachybotrys elegans]|uniref:General substrate transporter n=1 Tax=Stachybotrys elegans TaxID=80388 RepID=A0A8K0T953_9HYPO|nr:general substrate transporter [Stachybotrys elegans]